MSSTDWVEDAQEILWAAGKQYGVRLDAADQVAVARHLAAGPPEAITAESVLAAHAAAKVPKPPRGLVRMVVSRVRQLHPRPRQEDAEPVAPLRLLMIAAGPDDQKRLRLDAEHREIKARVRASSGRDAVSIEFAGAARPTDLIDEINRAHPTVLHYSGHGDATGVALEADDGSTQDMSGQDLARLISVANDDLRLVVLNSCESAAQAQPLVATVDAAIGMRQSIGDEAARTFAAQLYSSLAEGIPLDRAFEQSKLQMRFAGVSDDDVPALFTRAGVEPKGIVFTR